MTHLAAVLALTLKAACGRAQPTTNHCAKLSTAKAVGHSCDVHSVLRSYWLLVTTSFSGSDRMDNLLKDHRCPTFARFVR